METRLRVGTARTERHAESAGLPPQVTVIAENGTVTAAPDLAPALAVLPPRQLERALIRRFMRATIGGLGTPCVTEYPVLAAAVVMGLVCGVAGLDDDGDDDCAERAGQRLRDVERLRVAARTGVVPSVPAQALEAAAAFLTAAPLSD